MRQRFGILITIILAIVVLIAINSLAYVSEDEQQDSELSPNRSTYNAGATGTRALYDLLHESGYKVTRWRETPERLFAAAGEKVQTFVIIGKTKVSFEEDEAENLLRWVERGGRLVIIDRRPELELIPESGEWIITTEFLDYPTFGVDPAKQDQMIQGIKPISPVQPTPLTHGVDWAQPSRYFSAIRFSPASNDKIKKPGQNSTNSNSPGHGSPTTENLSAASSPAPVVHLSSGNNNLLIDFAHGTGRIVVLSDPFMVANDGIGMKDNGQLAINLLVANDGVIAFDEFHQGRGVTHNAFANYFAGTPVLAIGGQILLLIILIVWTRGRRFARPLPLPRLDRRSSLEFVASMAELQERAGAYDLAIENIYSRTRRVLARYAGVDYSSSRTVIAAGVAARSPLPAHQVETLMRQSEEAINGGPISDRQSVHLVRRLRELERSLGLRMRSREVKQTAQNI